MKKAISAVGKWFMTTKSEAVVDGIKAVGKNKLNKKKVGIVLTIVLAILLLCGVISEETFIGLFGKIN
tara:strand:+ start:1430 stop:1633 length:204 start_codon:yes stop_codon:yes gene_type:complete